ncbi:autotransporter outer membrane beta-barrel domain-containing protein [Maricaulis parjimensis]|uniref:autotransporter family protein n=1 Tax=Maricaulis parjimensis TaxID=144023 RepID=UPI00193976E1|nr:autotransporter outer membrane beta-barrel domain-containing protein [Maricaulis parjimensis]
MRRRYMFASALVTLTVAAPSAFADREITDEITTSVATSTAGTSGGPDNIVITSTGRVVLATPGTAVTLDSDNSVTMDGEIEIISDDDGGIGIHVVGGNTGDLNIGGNIAVEAESRPVDDDDEADADFPNADGPTAIGGNRIGVLVDGAGNFVGDVIMDSSGSISVIGNDSAGLQVLTGIDGNISLQGALSVIGDRSTALDLQGDLSGDLDLLAGISFRGEDSYGVRVQGDVGGSFYLGGTISGTAYRFSSYSNNDEFLATLDEDDMWQANSAISVEGSIANGILFDAPTDDNRVTRTSGIAFRGSAPAMQILASSGDITIGEAIQPAVEDNADTTDVDESLPETPLSYSFVMRGTISTNSALNDASSTGLYIGGADDGMGGFYTASLTHGWLLTGGISAIAYTREFDAPAIAIHLDQGAFLPIFVNDGDITATHNSVGRENAVTGTSYALLIEDGAVFEELVNNGSIVAQSNFGGDAYGVIDESGTLTNVTNTGIIQVTRSPLGSYLDADNNVITPDDRTDFELVAFDGSANSTGITFRQYWEPIPDDGNDDTVELTIVDQQIYMIGDVRFGSGDDSFLVEAGVINGAISFGDGQDALVIDGTTVYNEIQRLIAAGELDELDEDALYAELPYVVSAVTDSDGNLSIAVDLATLELVGSGALNISDARFGDGAVLLMEVDAEANSLRNIVASGDLVFETGSRLSVSLSNLIGNGGEFELIRAGNLVIEEDLATLNDSPAPFLYEAALEIDPNDPNVILLTLQRKSAEALGFDVNQAAAYDAAFATWSDNEALGAALASLTSQDTFRAAYDQLLPEYTAGAIQFALAANDSATGALANRLEAVRRSPDETGGLWLQEFAYFADRAGNAFGPGYRGQGIGVAVGFDRPLGMFSAVGLNFVAAASEVEEVEGVDDPMSALTAQLGVYAGTEIGGLNLDLYGAGGFDSFEHNRRVLIGEFDALPTAEWTGYHVSGSARLSRDFEFGGRYYVRPAVSVDYLALFEESYVESGGGIGIDLSVSERESTSFTGSGLLTFGAVYEGNDSWWSPHVRVGYRGEFAGDEVETDVSFVDYNDVFTLRSQQVPGSGFLFGFGLSAGSGYSTFSFDYDADVRDELVRHTARLVMRLVF